MCRWGDTVWCAVTIPAELSCTGRAEKRGVMVDRCIAPIVDALNAGGVLTANSCCGHGKAPGEIVLHDGRTLVINGGAS